MKIEKIFKRFLKEHDIFNTQTGRDVINFMYKYNEAILPFDAFRWDTTKQGYKYWLLIAYKWLEYLYINIDNIDEDQIMSFDITIGQLSEKLYELMDDYDVEPIDAKDKVWVDKMYKEISSKTSND